MPVRPRPLSRLCLPILLLAMVTLSGCLARPFRDPPPDGDRTTASTPRPVSTATPTATLIPIPTAPPLPTDLPRPTATSTTTPTPRPTPLPRPTPTPTFVHAVPSPTPSLTVSGTYDNRMEHADGRYELQLAGARVAATFATARSPVQHWAKEVPQPLFTVPEPFRPPYSVLRTAEGTPVLADGTPDPDHPEPRRFLLRVEPDGTLHYVDDDHVEGVGHLAYALNTVWGTTAAANDRAVLEILDRHWFLTTLLGETLLSAEPPPVQFEFTDTRGGTPVVRKVGAFVTLDADGRVTALGTPDYALDGFLLPELGQLSRLEYLDLSFGGMEQFHLQEKVEILLAGAGRPSGDPTGPEVTETDIEWLLEFYEQYPDTRYLPLHGAIPPQLGQLSRLRHLNLARNWLTGPIPPEIGLLTSLEYLHLGDNWLSGPLLPELSQLRDLERLYLGDNQLSGPLPPEWGQLASLQLLGLGDNRLTGPLPSEWGQLTSLKWLGLSGNRLTGSLPLEWGQLTSLERLWLSGNQLTGSLPSEWGQLTSLERLWLSTNLRSEDNLLTGCLPRSYFPNLIDNRTGLPKCPPHAQGH